MINRGVNKVILIGNLGQTPELKYMPNGKAILHLNVATSNSWRNKHNGEYQTKTEWHRVVMFSKLAESASKYLQKGSLVYIEGSLQTRKWQNNQGQDKFITEVIVNLNGSLRILSFTDRRSNNNNNNNNNNKLNLEESNQNFNSFDVNNVDNKIENLEQNIMNTDHQFNKNLSSNSNEDVDSNFMPELEEYHENNHNLNFDKENNNDNFNFNENMKLNEPDEDQDNNIPF